MNRLKELRQKNGISQMNLANRIGVAQSTLSGWENGKFEIDNKNLFKLSNIFHCSIDYLLGRETEPNSGKLSDRDEKDIQKRLKSALGELESTHSALMFDGEPLDDETRELLIASLERTIRQAKILAKEKYTPKKYKGGKDDTGGKF